MRPKVRNCRNYNRKPFLFCLFVCLRFAFTIFHTGSFQVPSEKAHSVKSVRIQSYSGPHFPAFSRISPYSVRMQEKCGPE